MLNNKNNKTNVIPPPQKSIKYNVQYRPRGINYIPIEENNNSLKIKPNNTTSMPSTLLEGFTFGIGSSIGNNIINKIFSKNNSKIVHSKDEDKNKSENLQEECNELFEELEKCVTRNDFNEENECSKKYEKYYKKCNKLIDSNYLMNNIKNKE